MVLLVLYPNIQPFVDRIRNPHFAKTTMMHDKLAVTTIAYVMHLGISSDPVEAKGVNLSIKASLTRDGEQVLVHQIIHVGSVISRSNEEHTLSGILMGSDNNLEGNIKLYRTGPYPDPKDYGSVALTNGEFQFPNLPYGAYKIDYENNCGCATLMESSFIFKDDETNIFEVEETKKNVTVGLSILDSANEPLVSAAVTMQSSDCVKDGKNASGTTNDKGLVTFTDIPIGKYDVSVDGKAAGSLTFCDNYNGTLVVSANHLWKFKVNYNSPYGNGTITATDIFIDFEAQADPGGTKIYAMTGSTCGGALFGCGDFLILNDSLVKPGSKWVSFNSRITIDRENNIDGDMVSGEIDYGMNGLVCDGHIPDGFGADSDTTTWTYSNGFSSWTMTLEPCKSSGCD